MKKITAILVMSAMLLSFASCGKKDSSEKNDSNSSSAEPAQTTAEETTAAPESTESGNNKDNKNVNINDYITVDTPTPALWKATDPETGNELYLMGTIHVISEEKFSLPDYILDVYENSDGVAVEYDVRELEDMSVIQDFVKYMVYTDGTKISDHISDEAYEAGKSCLQDLGMYNSMLDVYMPGFWLNQIEAMTMMSIEDLSNDGVDSKFIDMAANDGKEVINIETLEIQANVMAGYPDDYADYCLKSLPDEINDKATLADYLGQLYDMWASGKIDEMEKLDDEINDIPEDLLDSYEKYNDAILYKRNEGMADRAAEFLKNGDNYFFMVGSLHFSGDKGVDDLLEAKGYTVERIH